jgi:hypothetical protein
VHRTSVDHVAGRPHEGNPLCLGTYTPFESVVPGLPISRPDIPEVPPACPSDLEGATSATPTKGVLWKATVNQ